MKKFLIVTDYRGIFRRGIKSYYSMDLEKMKTQLEKKGYEVEILTYLEIMEKGIEKIKNYRIIYTSSANEEYKKYIDDIIYFLKDQNEVIPKYDILKCQENKGYQEIYKIKMKIKSLNVLYLSSLQDFNNVKNKLKYPLILKKINGAGSQNVFKLISQKELEKKIKKEIRIKNYYMSSLKRIYSKIVIGFKQNKKLYENYIKEDLNLEPYILQEFIPNLEEDWKILIFGKKFYVLNRKVRVNDFRASGSGRLAFIDPPLEILNYALEIYLKLDTPIISLDICMDKDKQCYLIEFQGLHFGPYTIINSEYYFELKNKKWEKIQKKSEIAIEYINSIIGYLNEKN